MRKKVSIVGAGNVGGSVAQRLAETGITDIVLADVFDGIAQGKALDLAEAGPVVGYDCHITGATLPADYSLTADSDVVVFTSGAPRKPGMSRDDLLATNQKIVVDNVTEIVRHSPNCILVMVNNPLDAMAHLAFKTAGFPKSRVVGQAGVLDTARFRTFLAMELDVSVDSVQAYVLGGHGDDMVPLVSYTTVGGIPVSRLIPADRLASIVERTRKGGQEIVDLLKSGSAYQAPAAATAQMVTSMLLDRKSILPCSTYLEGEYGIHDLFVGVPCKLGAHGVEAVMQIDLAAEELDALHRTAESVRSLVHKLGL
ncbi:MAG: malate dehydrogenase [Chloroflexota bacterium]|jgi:malate dehydrogenase|nr:malate dehydrogenase [Pseudomonadota bacterium]